MSLAALEPESAFLSRSVGSILKLRAPTAFHTLLVGTTTNTLCFNGKGLQGLN